MDRDTYIRHLIALFDQADTWGTTTDCSEAKRQSWQVDKCQNGRHVGHSHDNMLCSMIADTMTEAEYERWLDCREF
jgi:hypothetical protein